ncbi:type VI secretion system tube protein Hcp [Pseudomonas aeruginosa]
MRWMDHSRFRQRHQRDSLLVGYENKIEIMSYSHNVAMQVTNDVSNSERTSGKPHVGEFTLTKFIDTSTPTLNEYCCRQADRRGDHHHRPQRRRGNGQIMPFIVYTLNNVVLSNVSVSGAPAASR